MNNIDLILKKIYDDEITLDTVVVNDLCYICLFQDMTCVIIVHNELNDSDIIKLNLILTEANHIVQQNPFCSKDVFKAMKNNFQSLFDDDYEGE